MLSNTLQEKLSSFFSSLLSNREETIEKIYDPSSDMILVNGKQVSTKNNNSDINIIFPEFVLEAEQEQNNQATNNPTHSTPNTVSPSVQSEDQNAENSAKAKKNPSVSLISNGIFPIFYITFAVSFLIFLFLYEKSSIKIKENYIQIGNSKLFVFNFFRLQKISHFIFHTFTFYTAIFGFCIVYIAFASVYAKNSVLPGKAKFSNLYFYVLFAFGFFSNLLKFVSGILVFVDLKDVKAEKANSGANANSISNGYSNLKYFKTKFAENIQEIIFNLEIYLTIAYGVLLFHFLKYLEDHFSKDQEVKSCSNAAAPDSNSSNPKVVLIPSNNNVNNNSCNENSMLTINYNNNHNNPDFSMEENEINENLIHKDTLPEVQSKSVELLEPKWLKFKLFAVLYLFFMLLCLHLLKISEKYFLVSKTNLERNSYGMLKKSAEGSASLNYQYLVAFLPYGIYLVNSIFYFLNYGLLKNSQVKLFIVDNKGN